MEIKTEWKDQFKKGEELTLVTASKASQPHANIVISLGFLENNILIADCQMDKTRKNLEENPQVCVIAGYIRVKGTAKIHTAGKPFILAKEENEEYEVKAAITIAVDEVIDLDKQQRLA